MVIVVGKCHVKNVTSGSVAGVAASVAPSVLGRSAASVAVNIAARVALSVVAITAASEVDGVPGRVGVGSLLRLASYSNSSMCTPL